MLTAFSFDEIDQDFVDVKLFEKIDKIVKRLSGHGGVRMKSDRKNHGASNCETFTGADLVVAIKSLFNISDNAEAINLAHLLLHYGYIYPADGQNSALIMKDDGTTYKFQPVNTGFLIVGNCTLTKSLSPGLNVFQVPPTSTKFSFRSTNASHVSKNVFRRSFRPSPGCLSPRVACET
eukprot:gene9413-17127_t